MNQENDTAGLEDRGYAPQWFIDQEVRRCTRDKICLDCKYFDEFDEPVVHISAVNVRMVHIGSCHRYPPSHVSDRGTSDEMFWHPTVEWDGWCGEFDC